MPARNNLSPLIAVLKTNPGLAPFREIELRIDEFPDMIELYPSNGTADGPPVRKFFRIGITDRRAIYREGVSYRISQ